MRFVSTGGGAQPVSASVAIRAGLAPDGGLFLPERLPRRSDWRALEGATLAEVGASLLTPFLDREASVVRSICDDAFDFAIPIRRLADGIHCLEVFHGPTLAFKDVGARFLARWLGRSAEGEPTVLVATSGDTGGAVAQAFYGVPGTQVVVLYPRGRVSERQERQFATLGGNVLALAVEGAFDDCQRLVKEAFARSDLSRRWQLTSANSINIGRLLPQMVYYVWGWLELGCPEEGLRVCVPSGNFGNLTAGLMARELGLPIDSFLAATNANDVVPEFLVTGIYRPRPSVSTPANAMDVGSPSNLERVRALFQDDLEALRRVVEGVAISDREILAEVEAELGRSGTLLDPHTAVAVAAVRRARAEGRSVAVDLVIGTAHPAKFAEVLEGIPGAEVGLPPALSAGFERELQSRPLAPELPALEAAIEAWREGRSIDLGRASS